MAEFHLDDTIAALATPVGEGGLAVIRISGKNAFKMASKIFQPRNPEKWRVFESHTIHLGQILREDGILIDQVLVGIFKGPNSYTGEDVAEISSHGSMMVVQKILELLIQSGVRHAEPGEFTKRAFLNGKIDLTQAEAVLDLIKANSERSVEVAASQLAGNLSSRLKKLKEKLMHLYAHLEAYLDFPDEHLEVYTDGQIGRQIAELSEEMKNFIAGFKRTSLLKEGVSIAIVGKPNVGKSSLFNAILDRDRALVSPYKGTTRDHLEEAVQMKGVCVRLIDTAGLTASVEHPLDRIGIDRAHRAFETAQAFLFLVDGSELLEDDDRLAFEAIKNGKPILTIIHKIDLDQKINRQDLKKLTNTENCLFVSSKSREGLDALENQVIELIFGRELQAEGEQITRLRHKHAFDEAYQAMLRAEENFHKKESLELIAVEIKAAIDGLRELVGEIYSEDLLDVIFSEFCIGK